MSGNEHIIQCLPVRSEGTRYFFLSRSPILALGAFSTITWKREKRERSQINQSTCSTEPKLRFHPSQKADVRVHLILSQGRTEIYLALMHLNFKTLPKNCMAGGLERNRFIRMFMIQTAGSPEIKPFVTILLFRLKIRVKYNLPTHRADALTRCRASTH